MKSVDCKERPDGAILAAAGKQYPAIAAFRLAIRVAYKRYRESKCKQLDPIEMDPVAADALRLAYRSEAKSAKLSWISEVRNGHSFNFCPVCGGPGVKTLDHHLPQTAYPEFSVFSFNLVPSCAACNTKRNNWNMPGREWTLHPYFDSAVLSQVRLAVYIEEPWEAPLFHIRILPGLNADDLARVELHISKSLDLSLFGSWIRGQWIDLRVVRVPTYADAASLRATLARELTAEETRNPNSWNAALIRGVLASPALCGWLIDNPLGSI